MNIKQMPTVSISFSYTKVQTKAAGPSRHLGGSAASRHVRRGHEVLSSLAKNNAFVRVSGHEYMAISSALAITTNRMGGNK